MRAGLSLAVILVPGVFISTALLGTAAAWAQDADGKILIPHGVSAAVGNIRFEITACQNGLPRAERRVAVYTSNSGYSETGFADSLLNLAVQYAWQHCPLHFRDIVNEYNGYQRNVSSVDVYFPDGTLAIHAENYWGDIGMSPGQEYHWGQISYPAAEQRQAAATQAAEQQQQNQMVAENTARVEARDARWAAQVGGFFGNLIVYGFVALGLFVLGFMYTKREPLARWYYFTFFPHPAQVAVDAAISRHTLLHGKHLAAILGEVPPGNTIFRQVRIEQALTLTEAMKAAAAERLDELRKRTSEEYERAAVFQAQAAIGEAAIALEKAKAMLKASKRSY